MACISEPPGHSVVYFLFFEFKIHSIAIIVARICGQLAKLMKIFTQNISLITNVCMHEHNHIILPAPLLLDFIILTNSIP